MFNEDHTEMKLGHLKLVVTATLAREVLAGYWRQKVERGIRTLLAEVSENATHNGLYIFLSNNKESESRQFNGGLR